MPRHAAVVPMSNLSRRIEDALQAMQCALDEVTSALADMYAAQTKPMSVWEVAFIRWVRARAAMYRCADALGELLDERLSA